MHVFILNISFKGIRDEIRSLYKRQLEKILAVPWLPETAMELMEIYVAPDMESDYRWSVLVYCYETCLFICFLLFSEKEVISMNGIFIPRKGQRRLSNILVEGDPGSGKSTLLKKFALEWAQDTHGDHCGPRCIHQMDLVIALHSKQLARASSIAKAIADHLLDDASMQWPLSLIDALFATRRILITVDAYDEDRGTKDLLHKVIKRKHLDQTMLLVTSRPGYIREKSTLFDSTFRIQGYSQDQRRDLISRFARQQGKSLDEFQPLIEMVDNDLAGNPLNLTLMCLLHVEGELKMTKQAELYACIHRFILRKASERLHLSIDEINLKMVGPLSRLAFEAYERGEAVFEEEDFRRLSCDGDEIREVGYLTKETTISKLEATHTYSFPHRTFMEFLTAIHLSQDPTTRSKWISQLSDKKNFIRHKTVASFLFALLESDAKALVKIAKKVMRATRFSTEVYHSSRDPAHPHCILHFIHQLNNVPSQLQNLIAHNMPSWIYISDACSSACCEALVSMPTAWINDRTEQLVFLDPIARNVIPGLIRNAARTTSLRRLAFYDGCAPDDPSLFSALRHLHLQQFIFRWHTLSDDAWAALSSSIATWNNLTHLDMYDCSLGSASRASHQKLFAAIEGCRRLEELRLHDTGMTDEMLGDASEMIVSLPQLKRLDLEGNQLTARGLRLLATALRRRHTKLEKLGVEGNAGCEDERVMEELRKNCCHELI